MKNEFLRKVIDHGTIDTRKYRYVAKENPNGSVTIKRIEKEHIGYTTYLDEHNWKAIKTFSFQSNTQQEVNQ